jgi:tetratricopeptide (TPR) repeat protein
MAIANSRKALALDREIGDSASEASDLQELAHSLYLRGDVAVAEKLLNQTLEISQRIGDKSTCGDILTNIGDVLMGQGKLKDAMVKYDEAINLLHEIGSTNHAAENRMSLALLLLEENRAKEAEALARDADDVFQKQDLKEDQISAHAVLAQALLAQGKVLEARKEIDNAKPLLSRSLDTEVRFNFGIVSSSVSANSPSLSERSRSVKSLESIIENATRLGYIPYRLEAQLALGEIEMKLGQGAAGRKHLAAAEKEARSKGFGLVAQKAAKAQRARTTVLKNSTGFHTKFS